MTYVLHDYQRVGVDHLHRNPRAGLFLDMGLGKTATALTALTADHLPALVVAPKRVAEETWPVEAAIWRPDLRIAVAAGTPARRRAALAAGADVTVIGRDNLADAVGGPWRTFVLDELSGFKSWATARFKAGKRISEAAEYVWGLTGTPSPNGLLDLWAQIYIIDNGARLGRYITHYRQRYFYAANRLPSGVVTEWALRPGAEEAIHRQIDDICLSMGTDGRIALPPTTFNRIDVPLPAAAARAYKTLKNDLVVDLNDLGLLDAGVHTAETAAALSNRLSQISAGWLYRHDPDTGEKCGVDQVHTAKLSALREVIDGTGSPVLVFYRYQTEYDAIRREFGDAVRSVKEKGVVAEWNEGKVPILLAHPASAGHGLNLQHGGHTIVWTSLPWSLEEWQQANKRLARQGQKNPVVIHILMARKTIDASILMALESKKSVQQALLDHLESPL